MDRKRSLYLVIIFIIGLSIRLYRLGERPLWIDEAKYAENIQQYQRLGYFRAVYETRGREFLLTTIGYSFNLESDLELRLPVAILTSLSILALLVLKNKKNAVWLALLICFCPLFIFWGRMARPYAAACFFLVLGWRWWGFYILAILVNPISIIGINLFKIKQRWLVYIGLIVLSVFLYKIQPISGHFNLEFLYHAKRLWVIPLLSTGLHVCDWEYRIPGLCDIYLKLARFASGRLRNKQKLFKPLFARKRGLV